MKHTTIIFHALSILLLSINVYSLFIPRLAKIKNQSLKGHFVNRRQQLPSRSSLIRNRSIAPIYLPIRSSLSDDGESTQENYARERPENSKQLLSDSFPIVKGVTLKMAFDRAYSVADASELKSERFTCAQSLDLVHKLRRNSDCVLVGRETVMRDDCTLTVRRVDLLEDRKDHPVRVVIDSNLKLLGKEGSRIEQETNEAFIYPKLLRDGHRTIIYHQSSGEKINNVGMMDNVTLVKISTHDENNGMISPSSIIKDLEKRNIHHVMVEGGPATALKFLKEKLVDRAMLIRAPVNFIEPVPSGMSDEILEEAGLVLLDSRECGDDVVEYWVRQGESWPADRVEDWPI